MPISRRDVLYGLSSTLASPLLLTRADAEVTPDIVKFRPEIEPLVALLERTLGDALGRKLVIEFAQLHAGGFRLLGAPNGAQTRWNSPAICVIRRTLLTSPARRNVAGLLPVMASCPSL